MSTAGIVRPARRPAGWTPPGPAPRPPRDAEALGPRASEDLCYLAGDWRIFQRRDGHRWSLDDLVTAWFAASVVAPAEPARVADLGCGIGSVLLLLAWRFPGARLVGVEAQALSVDLARRSIAWNGVAERCEVRHGDLRDERALAEAGRFELVTGTPPYLTPGSAVASARVQKTPCSFEERGGIEAYLAAAARLLAPGGVFVACEQARQDERVRRAAATAGLPVAATLPVVPRAGRAPLFAVYACRPGAPPEAPAPLAPLVVRDDRGQWTLAFRRVRTDLGLPA